MFSSLLKKKKHVACDECHQKALKELEDVRTHLMGLDKDTLKVELRRLGEGLKEVELPL